jgi:hypothetical protein
MKTLLYILSFVLLAGCDDNSKKDAEAQKAVEKAATSGNFGKVKPLDLSDAFTDGATKKPEKDGGKK